MSLIVDNLFSEGNITGTTVSAATYLNLPYQYEQNVSQFNSFYSNVYTLSNSIQPINAIFCYPIFIQRELTINELSIWIATASAGASIGGLYDSNGTGLPDNLLFQTTPFNNAVTGAQTITLPTPITVTAGLYYIGFNTSSSASFRSVVGGQINVLSLINANTAPHGRIFKTWNYNGTLPPNFGAVAGAATKTASTNPHILFNITY